MSNLSDGPVLRQRPVLFSLILCCVVLAVAARPPVMAQDTLDRSEEIVYIDSNGFIRVLDPDQTADNPAVQWRSPDGNWYDAAIGDVNGDGDGEIVAIGPGSGGSDTVRLTVYDPVVSTGPVDPDRRINGIPWDRLYTTEMEGDPLDIATGLFTLNQPQDGIVVGVVSPGRSTNAEAPPSRISLLDPTSADGRAWDVRFERDFSNEWTLIRSGNADNRDVDEVVLVDEGRSVLSVYRVQNEMSDEEDRIFVNGSESKGWNDAIITAQQSENLLAKVRGAPQGYDNLFVARYPGLDGVEWQDVYTEWFNPAALRIFAADVNNNGDDELFLLRDVPKDQTAPPRLFMRNLGSDSPASFEVKLDDDNGYREGAGGNIYGGDGGKDEVVIIRDNNLRVYTQPEVDQQQSDFGRSTNQRTVLVGDLDAVGFVQRAALVADPNALDERIKQGQTSGPYVIDLVNDGSDQATPFSYGVQGNPSWIAVAASGAETPARFEVTFDASKLLSGHYRSAIDITTTYPDIINSSLTIPITLTVESAIVVTPDSVFFAYYPCQEPLEPRAQTFALTGPISLEFSARVAPNAESADVVPWAMIDPTGGYLPSAVTLTVDPNRRTDDLEEAVLILSESESSGLEQHVPIVLICAQARSYLPLIANE